MKIPTPDIRLSYQPPSNGWLTLTILVNGQAVVIDASDVPNNPVEELLAAVDLAASGVPSSVWWHLEPHGYFMYFTPSGEDVQFKLVFAPESELSHGREVVETRGMSCKSFYRSGVSFANFSHMTFRSRIAPPTDYNRILVVKDKIRMTGVIV